MRADLVDRIVLRRTLSIIRVNFQMEEQASLLICQAVQQQHFAESRMQNQKKRLPQLRMRQKSQREAAKTTEKPARSRRVKKEAAEEVPAEKPKRGRPRKVKEQEPEETPKKEAAEVPTEKPKRGRPRKKPVEAAAPEK